MLSKDREQNETSQRQAHAFRGGMADFSERLEAGVRQFELFPTSHGPPPAVLSDLAAPPNYGQIDVAGIVDLL